MKMLVIGLLAVGLVLVGLGLPLVMPRHCPVNRTAVLGEVGNVDRR
jgi:hypothetical protein